MTAPDAAGDLHDVVEDRRAIIELLVDAGHPVSIGDIANRLPDLPRSSAYRHLVDLQVAGVVRRVAANDEFARYELSEEFSEHHHHLLCTDCGKVIDVTPSSAFERNVATTVVRTSQPPARHPRALH